MAREFYPTTAQVISAAARGLGLVTSDIADPFASTNPAILQMLQLLTDLGQDLARDYGWEQLRSSTGASIDLSASTSVVGPGTGGRGDALPSDFGRVIADSVWNRTTQQPLYGPVSQQTWAELTALGTVASINLPWRLDGDLFYIYSSALEASSSIVTYDYYSRHWVRTAAGDDLSLDAPAAASNVLCFDKRLLVEGLKLRFAEAKGMPAEALQRRYEDALVRAQSLTEPGRVKSLNSPYGMPWPRTPETGYGS